MNIFSYCLIFSILFSVFISLSLWAIGKNKSYKLYKKHLLRRKTYFLVLSFLALLFLWGETENIFSEITQMIVYGIHGSIFIGFLGFSLWKLREDKQRILSAKQRRLAKESQK